MLCWLSPGQVRKHKRAVEQATQLVEAANSRMLELEQQLAVDSQEAAGQTQQLAEQAKSTVRLGAELRQVKQHMTQLHLSVVHPVLHWQHEQQLCQGQQGAEGTSSTRTSCSSSSRRKRSHKQWQPPATVTGDVIAATAAAVEQLLLQQAKQGQGQQRTSEQALLQRLQGKLACRDAEMQELRAELAACRHEAAHLQQQLDTARTQHEQSQQLHEQELAAKAQQAAEDAEQQLQAQQQALQELQQQVNKLLSELACAQGEAAAAQRQIACLQEDQQQAAAEHERELQQLKQVASSRYVSV